METAKTSIDRRAVAVLAIALVVPALEANAAEPDAVEEPAPDVDEAEDPTPLVVQIVGLEDASVREALALRLPDRPVLEPDDPRPDGAIAYAIVRRDPPQLRLTLILVDGRAYDRDVDDVPGQSERAAAGALVTLLHAVETGTAAPTRSDVQIPEPEPAPEPEPTPEPAPEPTPPPPAAPPAAEPAPPAPPIVELGPTLAPLVGVGIAPTGPSPPLLGAGGALSLDARFRSGAAATVELRALGRLASDFGLLRTRFALGGGYVLRVGAFELPILARAFVEPWWLRSDGADAPLVYGSANAPKRPLLGAGLRLSPGVLVRPHREGHPAIHVGARIELDGSFVPHEGARSIRLALEGTDGNTHLARLGGLEVGFGLDVTIWFPVKARE